MDIDSEDTVFENEGDPDENDTLEKTESVAMGPTQNVSCPGCVD